MDQYGFQSLKAFIQELYGAEKRLTIVPYAFTSTFSALAQNATQTNTISINANADFVCVEMRSRGNIGAAQNLSTVTAPFVRILVTDSGTGEQWTAAAVDLLTYTTNGQFGRQMEYPRWVAGRTALTVQSTNYAPTNETYSFDLVMAGVLVRSV